MLMQFFPHCPGTKLSVIIELYKKKKITEHNEDLLFYPCLKTQIQFM